MTSTKYQPPLDLAMHYCRRCGERLHWRSTGFWSCAQQHFTFNNPSPTVGVFFLTPQGDAVLSRRGIDPGKGMLDCIGGFVEAGESFEAAARREIREETGLTESQYSPLIYFCSAPATYRFQDEDRPIISNLFWSTLHPDSRPHPQDDVAEIVTLSLGAVTSDALFNDDTKQGFAILQSLLKEKQAYEF